jgi:glycosyltransferase involved in cell wall biosynthesis
MGAKIGLAGPEIADESWIRDEARWVANKLKEVRPDVAILCFDAIHFAPCLKKTGIALFGLPGSPMLGKELRAVKPSEFDASAEPTEEHLRIATALRQTDRVGFASYEDRDYASSYLGIKEGLVVGIGYPRVATAPAGSELTVLFVGNMTQSNEEALSWFLSQVWPNVRSRCPSARFRVVGRSVAAIKNGNPSASGIDLIGPVPDLRPEYEAAQIVVAPLLSGTTGVKVKVAEAMAYGRPLVTTSVGIDPGNRDQLDPGAIVANNAEDFAMAIVTLLKDPHARMQKTQGAREIFEKWFSREECYREIVNWINEIVQ